ADRNARLWADHAAIRVGAVDGLEIRRRAVLPGIARLAVDLRRLFRDDRRLHFSARLCAVAAETPLSGVCRLLQEPQRRRLHLPMNRLPDREKPAWDRKIAVMAW